MTTDHLFKHWDTLMLSLPLSSEVFVARGEGPALYCGQSVDDLVMQYMKKHQVPALSVAIVEAPYITRIVGYGLADQTTKRLAGSHTLFSIGQMTTAYTAVAIMQLCESGKLHLEDVISSYLPNIPKSWQDITIRELLSHTSGIPSYTEKADFSYSKEYNMEQIIALVKDQSLNFQAGTNRYSSATDFYLLAHIIEKASGISYEEFVTVHQFKRLGLRNTCFLSNIKNIPNELENGSQPFKHSAFKNQAIYINPAEPAVGYMNNMTEALSIHPSAVFGYASILSTAEEISIWDVGLAGDILVKDLKNREFLYNSVILNSGEKKPGNGGWHFPGHLGFMYIQGNLLGFSSHLSRYTAPNELICVTILANKDNLSDLTVLARQIAGAYNSTLAGPVVSPWSVVNQSPYCVNETIERLRHVILAQGGTVFAEVDHADNAAKAKQSLAEAKIPIVGNPSKGTDLIKANMAITLDLPLRISVWSDEKTKEVWVSFIDPVELARAYQVEGHDALLAQMRQGLCNAIKKAIISDFLY